VGIARASVDALIVVDLEDGTADDPMKMEEGESKDGLVILDLKELEPLKRIHSLNI